MAHCGLFQPDPSCDSGTIHGVSGPSEVTSVDCDSMLRIVGSQAYRLPDERSCSCGVASVCMKFSFFHVLVWIEHGARTHLKRMRVQLTIFLCVVEVDMLNPDWDVESNNRVGHALERHPHHPLTVHVELHTFFG